MEKILRIPFTEIDTADLLVDAVYEGGTAKNLGSEVLSKVMHVGNSGGFRKCMKLGENGKKAKDVAYVCIYTTGEEIEWRDEIDRTLGRFTYWGDNRKAGNPMTKNEIRREFIFTEYLCQACRWSKKTNSTSIHIPEILR